MKADLDAGSVAARLAELRAVYAPERVAVAQERLACERPADPETFEARAARSLAELRALCELARHLRHP